MKRRIPIWKSEEYDYPGAGKFIPYLAADIHEDMQTRPAMIVIPGGGFTQLCSGEADGVANEFYQLGYNTFVMVYTNNVTLKNPVFDQALKDVSRAVRLLRKNNGEYAIDSNRIHAIGFSGGGTLTASMATQLNKASLQDSGEYEKVSNRLNTATLVYAMTRSENKAGVNELMFKNEHCVSLDMHVDHTSVPIFILHGTADMMVPAEENALPMANAYAKNGIPYELHLLLGCDHGFIVGELDPKCAESSKYLFEQLYLTIEAMTDEEFATYGDVYGGLKKGMDYDDFAHIVQKEVMTRMWWKGLRIDPDEARRAVQATTTGDMHATYPANPSACKWWLMVDNWINMLFPRAC